MIIDVVFLVVVIWAIIKGYQKGLIIALFSIISLMVGLAAAIKLSSLAASMLKNSVNISSKWLPVVSFIVVFLLALLLVRFLATALEKMIELAMLGWLNRLGGIILYVVLYTLILSIVLFYSEKIDLINNETITASKTHPYIQPWGPWAINGIGKVIPVFNNMFHELEEFFGKAGAYHK
jgi:membrane protein required for colicin V production